MTRRELVEQLAASRGLPVPDAERILDAFVRTVERALTEGESVTLRTFGVFEVRRRAGRHLRPPSTGREMRVPARLAPSFRPSPLLARRVREAGPGA